MNTLEILDPQAGHITLEWDPDDRASVKRARGEFTRLKQAGYVFFSTPGDEERKRLQPADGKLDVRPSMTREFKARSPRTIARPPMRGG